MKLVVGLGNPGAAYKKTRHNVGFMVIEALCNDCNTKMRKPASAALEKAVIHYRQQIFVLCKPLTYMNLSGEAVRKLAKENNLKPEDILVVCDDIHLPLGRIKIKAGGSSGGHNGLASVLESLGTKNVSRLRIGISGSENKQEDLSKYVLANFSRQEQKILEASLISAKEAVVYWLENGIEKAMNTFNKAGE